MVLKILPKTAQELDLAVWLVGQWTFNSLFCSELSSWESKCVGVWH